MSFESTFFAQLQTLQCKSR